MFNPDFYPTPPGVAAEMLEQHRRPKRAGKRQGVPGIRHPLASAGSCSTASYSQTHHSM
jgi:hypothetical protein